MTMLALFELEATTWSPIYHPSLKGVDIMSMPKEDWKAYRAQLRCRDCGQQASSMKHTRGCGGANSDGAFDVCDECAAIDGRGRRPDASEADVSRWGERTTDEEQARLLALQAKRRATYLNSTNFETTGLRP